MIRVIHTGDLHLDSPFRGLPAEKARQRREEQRGLLERLAALCQEREADVVLIAGDLFDGDGVYYETTRMLADVFGGMKAKIFIAPGNHDPYSDYSPYSSVRWPDNVHVFHSEYFERVELPELGAVVYGTAFTSKYRDHCPLEHFKGDYDEGLTRLMVLHGDLSAPKSRYGALTGDQLGETGMDYIALGHIHQFTQVWQKEGTAYAYCGCPEGRGFDETGDKGVLAGTVAPGEVQMEFVPLCQRRYWDIPVDVTGKDPAAALLEAIPLGSGQDICRFRLVGERKEDALNLGNLYAQVEKKFFDVQLQDATRLETGLWDRLGEDNLTGLFLRNIKTRMEQASPEELPLLERAARFGLCALEGREEPR